MSRSVMSASDTSWSRWGGSRHRQGIDRLDRRDRDSHWRLSSDRPALQLGQPCLVLIRNCIEIGGKLTSHCSDGGILHLARRLARFSRLRPGLADTLKNPRSCFQHRYLPLSDPTPSWPINLEAYCPDGEAALVRGTINRVPGLAGENAQQRVIVDSEPGRYRRPAA
jgi:hypothetical protein